MAKLIGSEPNQVPTNGDLGSLAYVDKDSVIGQVVSVVDKDFGTVSVSAAVNGTVNPTDLGSLLSLNITPKSTNSKILVMCQLTGEMTPADPYDTTTFVLRDGSPIEYSDVTTQGNRGMFVPQTSHYSDNNSTMDSMILTYLDSPNTTNQVTYSVGVATGSNSTWYQNRTIVQSTGVNYESGMSTIIAIEFP